MDINEIRDEYPEANGCNGQSDHILGPWSPLIEAASPDNEDWSIQVAKCLRCGFVRSQALRVSKAEIEEGIARGLFLAGLKDRQWGMPEPESQLPCADESPGLG